jgi:hypothetical protein
VILRRGIITVGSPQRLASIGSGGAMWEVGAHSVGNSRALPGKRDVGLIAWQVPDDGAIGKLWVFPSPERLEQVV